MLLLFYFLGGTAEKKGVANKRNIVCAAHASVEGSLAEKEEQEEEKKLKEEEGCREVLRW